MNGSGGVVSTAEDLARWLIVHSNGGAAADGTRLVSESALDTLHTPGPAGGDYAMGWDLDRSGDRVTRIHHGGALFTASAEQILLPGEGGEPGYGIAVAFNSAGALGAEQMTIIEGLVEIVEGGGQPAAPVRVTAISDAAMAVLIAAALVVGALRVRRAGAWARRRARRSAPLLVLTLAPRLVPVALCLLLPAIAGLVMGARDVTWEAAWYGWPALVVWAVVAAAASAAVLAARVLHLVRERRSPAPPDATRPPAPRPTPAT
ncbi:hypothetical protein HNR12_002062 [Streptomonospora nanhaiensis]|uniref:Beta-lactamase-related domain-containing protein n=1 Tax=Streptomonospora nanhaiensis TaxID=1323731 RepID=A0A853BM47_9ACTN|nr:hypothetical protein [Streptomonospora nanhaiensis]